MLKDRGASIALHWIDAPGYTVIHEHIKLEILDHVLDDRDRIDTLPVLQLKLSRSAMLASDFRRIERATKVTAAKSELRPKRAAAISTLPPLSCRNRCCRPGVKGPRQRRQPNAIRMHLKY
jgi:hypothetical protein